MQRPNLFIMIFQLWKRITRIGCRHPHPPQSLDSHTVMLTNQIGAIAMSMWLVNGMIALTFGDVLYLAFTLLFAACFLPIWWLNSRGWSVWARTYTCVALYGHIAVSGWCMLDGYTKSYLYCFPFLIAFFVLFRERQSKELWLHITINAIVFVLMSQEYEGLNWLGLSPTKRPVIILSARLGSITASIVGLFLWFDLQEKTNQIVNRHKDFYKNIIDAISLPIAVFDSQLRFRIVNKASFQDDYMRQQVIGKTEMEYAALIGKHYERASLRTEKLKRCFDTWQRVLFEEQFEAEGYRRTNIIIMSPIVNENGERLVLAYLIDISAIRRYQEQLLQSQKTFEAVFENATDALFLVDTATKYINNCNAAALALFGYANKYDIKGKSINDTLLRISPELYKEVVDSITAKGKWEGECVYTRTDGSTFVGSTAVTRFMRQDMQFTLIRISDRTKQKEAETAIKNALHAAREAAEAKSQFLSKISHEIRIPLNAIVGLSRLMIDDASTVSKQNMEIIYQSSVSLLKMVNEILSFSKIEAGQEILYPQPTDWRALLEKILMRWRWQASQKGIELSLSAAPDIPKIIMLDGLRLEQIINNLLSNAVKFTEKGYIKISIAGKALPENTYRLDFEVADTGIGVPDDKKSIIFESFRQADKEIAYRFGGTGLGLAIAKQLVEMMGGHISVSDNKDGGSIFTFHIILQLPEDGDELENKEITMSENIPQDLKGLKILMAEDNTVNQFVARQIMGRWNVNLTFANNGQEALELLAKNTYQIVLMDIQMPVMDGIEATQRIRNAPPDSGINSQIPIIALTADALPETKEKVKKAGMNDIVVKPFDSDSLYALIQTFVE